MPKKEIKLKWRRLSRFVAFADLLSSIFSMSMIVLLGLAVNEISGYDEKTSAQLMDQYQCRDDTTACLRLHITQDMVEFAKHPFYVWGVIGLLTAFSMFFLVYSILLLMVTRKWEDGKKKISVVLEGALLWRDDMAQVLVFISIMFFLFVWMFNVRCYFIVAISSLIAIRSVFIFIVASFASELDLSLITGGSNKPKAGKGYKVKKIKVTTISV